MKKGKKFLTFNDELIESHIEISENDQETSFFFDYSPSIGKIIQLEPIMRFRTITELSLIGHEIEDITTLQSCQKLKKLNLSWNKISSMIPLTQISTLKILNLNHNLIQMLPKSISALINLQSLKLEYNPIADKSCLLNLKNNDNLACLDLIGSTVSADVDLNLYLIFNLPQISVYNREMILQSIRDKAAKRFQKVSIGTPEAFQQLQQENIHLKEQLQEQEVENQKLLSLPAIKTDSESLKLKIKSMEDRLHEMEKQLELKLKENISLKTQLKHSNQPPQSCTQCEILMKKLQKAQDQNVQYKSSMQELYATLKEEKKNNAGVIHSSRKSFDDSNLRREIIKLQQIIASKEDEIETLKQRPTIVQKVENNTNEILNYKSNIAKLKNDNSKLQEQIEKASQERKTLQRKIQIDAQTHNVELTSKIEEISSLKSDIQMKEAQIRELKANLQESSSYLIKVRSLEQENNDLKRHTKTNDVFKQIVQEKNQIEAQLNEQKSDNVQLNLKIKMLKKQLKQPQKEIDHMIMAKDQQIKQLELERKNLIATINKEIRTRDETITSLQNSLFLDNTGASRNNELEAKIEQLQDTLANVERSDEELREVQQNLVMAQTQIKKLEEENKVLEKTKENHQQEIEGLQNKIIEITSKKAKSESHVMNELISAHEIETNGLKNELNNKEKEIQQLHKLRLEHDQLILDINNIKESQKSLLEIINQERESFKLKKVVQQDLVLVLSQTFKEVHMIIFQLEQKLDDLKDKKQQKEMALETSVKEQAQQNIAIRTLQSKLAQTTKELSTMKEKLETSVSQTEYKMLKSQKEALEGEIEKNSITIKQFSSQFAQLKQKSYEEMNESRALSEEKISELEEELETTQNALKRKCESMKEIKSSLTRENQKLIITMHQLDEDNRKKEVEIFHMKEQLDQFDAFKTDSATTIERLEAQCKAFEENMQIKLKKSEEEKLKLLDIIDDLKKKIKELKSLLKESSNKQKTFESTVADKDKEIFSLENTIKKLEEQEKQQINCLKKQKEEHEKAEQSLTMMIQELETEKSELTQTTRDVQSEQEQETKALKRQIKKLQKKFNNLVEISENLKSEKESLESQLQTAKAEIDSKEDEYKKKDGEIARIREMRETTEHLFKTLTVKHNKMLSEIEGFNQQLDDKEKEKEEVFNKISEYQKENLELSQKIAEVQKREIEASQKSDESKKEIENLKIEIQTRDEIVHGLHQSVKNAEKNVEIKEQEVKMIQSSIDQLKSKYEMLQKTTVPTTQFQNVVNKLSEAKQAHNEATHQIEVLNKKLEKSIKEIEIKEDQIKELEEDIKDLNAKVKEGEEYKKVVLKQKLQIEQLIEKNGHQQNLISTFKANSTQASEEFMKISTALEKSQNDSYEQKVENAQLLQQISELQDNFKQKEQIIEHNEEIIKNIKNELETLKKAGEETKDEQIRQLSLAKKQIRDMNEEKEQFNIKMNQLTADLEVANKNIKQMVPKQQLTELKKKYESLEKLQDFTDSKLKSSESKFKEIQAQLHDIHDSFNEQIHEHKPSAEILETLRKVMNKHFESQGFGKIQTFLPKQKLVISDVIVASVDPESETMIGRQQRLLDSVRKTLLSFPLGNKSLDLATSDQLENQLDQLHMLVNLIKRLFDEREVHIEELVSMIESQHNAILQISNAPTDKSVVSKSVENVKRAKLIIEEDRSKRKQMDT